MGLYWIGRVSSGWIVFGLCLFWLIFKMEFPEMTASKAHLPRNTKDPHATCVLFPSETAEASEHEEPQYTYSFHCSSFSWFNQFYTKDPKR